MRNFRSSLQILLHNSLSLKLFYNDWNTNDTSLWEIALDGADWGVSVLLLLKETENPIWPFWWQNTILCDQPGFESRSHWGEASEFTTELAGQLAYNSFGKNKPFFLHTSVLLRWVWLYCLKRFSTVYIIFSSIKKLIKPKMARCIELFRCGYVKVPYMNRKKG